MTRFLIRHCHPFVWPQVDRTDEGEQIVYNHEVKVRYVLTVSSFC